MATPARAARSVADRALTIGAILGLAALLSALLGAALGVRPLFFRSGSMAPTIGTGSLALARSVPASGLRAGDVVSVVTASGTRVTHRVVRVDPVGPAQVSLTLRGDANRAEDSEHYVVGSAYRVFWHVPWLGYAAGTVLSPRGIVAFAVLALIVLALSGGRDAYRGPRPHGRHARAAAPRHRHRRAGAAVVATAAVLAGPAGPASAAPWTDDVVVSGTTLTASTVPASGSFTCGVLGVGSVTFNWSAVPGATSYTLHYGSGGASTLTVAGTSQTVVTLVTGGTAWVQANTNYGSVTWTSVASQTRTYSIFALVISTCS